MFPRNLRPLAAALAICVSVGFGPLGAPETTQAGTYLSTSEQQLVTLINNVRLAHGLRALRVGSTLYSVARWRSWDMNEHDWGGHKIPSLSCAYVNKKLNQLGVGYKRWGEVWAWNVGYSALTSATKAFKLWMNSSTHRAIILNPYFTHLGVGSYKGTWRYRSKCGQYGTWATYSGAIIHTVVFIQKA